MTKSYVANLLHRKAIGTDEESSAERETEGMEQRERNRGNGTEREKHGRGEMCSKRCKISNVVTRFSCVFSSIPGLLLKGCVCVFEGVCVCV